MNLRRQFNVSFHSEGKQWHTNHSLCKREHIKDYTRGFRYNSKSIYLYWFCINPLQFNIDRNLNITVSRDRNQLLNDSVNNFAHNARDYEYKWEQIYMQTDRHTDVGIDGWIYREMCMYVCSLYMHVFMCMCACTHVCTFVWVYMLIIYIFKSR